MNLELFIDQDGKPRLHIVGRNGEIVMSSEAYQRKANAVKSAKKLLAAWGDSTLAFVDKSVKRK